MPACTGINRRITIPKTTKTLKSGSVYFCVIHYIWPKLLDLLALEMYYENLIFVQLYYYVLYRS